MHSKFAKHYRIVTGLIANSCHRLLAYLAANSLSITEYSQDFNSSFCDSPGSTVVRDPPGEREVRGVEHWFCSGGCTRRLADTG